MTLRDLCDVAYVLQFAEIERSNALGDPDAIEAMRDEFDAALVSDPTRPKPTPTGRASQMNSLLTDSRD